MYFQKMNTQYFPKGELLMADDFPLPSKSSKLSNRSSSSSTTTVSTRRSEERFLSSPITSELDLHTNVHLGQMSKSEVAGSDGPFSPVLRQPFVTDFGNSVLQLTRDVKADAELQPHLRRQLEKFILLKCSQVEYCNVEDFDDAALEALTRVPFLQALQTVEHYSCCVSPRIHRRAAYLMGILRVQEAHWDRFHSLSMSNVSPPGIRGKQVLNLPVQVLFVIAHFCLKGNCLPSDFSDEVCSQMHNLTLPLALKALVAFNANKRIIAGTKGGVVNRSRFFLRLIQNVSQQAPVTSEVMHMSELDQRVEQARARENNIKTELEHAKQRLELLTLQCNQLKCTKY